MITKKVNDLSVLQSELLLAAGVPHGWFDSTLGNVIFRPGNPFEDPEWVDEAAMTKRRTRACNALGLDGSRLVITSGLLQTDIVQTVSPTDAGKKIGPADGYTTNIPGLPIVIAAGDCIQAIMYAPDVNVMAVVHAGGLGTSRQIFVKALQRLATDFKADPRHVIVAIGPSVSAEHFVPTLEADNFTLTDIAHTHPVTKKLSGNRIGYDITATNIRQLRDLGVPAEQIEASDIDTFTHDNWYSYERDKMRDMAAAMRRHGLFVALPQK